MGGDYPPSCGVGWGREWGGNKGSIGDHKCFFCLMKVMVSGRVPDWVSLHGLGGRAGMFMNEEQRWGWAWVGEGRGILKNDPSPGKHRKTRKSKPRNLTPWRGERPETGITYISI